MLKLSHCRAVTPFRILEDTCILCEGEQILRVGPDDGTECPTLDLSGLLVTPGFVDAHVHGGGGCEFWTDDPQEILRGAAFLARHGTTALLPSVNYARQMDLDQPTRAKLSAMHQAMEARQGPELLGLHLEGPHIAPSYPMIPDQPLNPALPERYLAFLDQAPPVLKWTVAPEVEGVPELIRVLLERGIHVSLGHSDCGMEDIYPAYEAGVRQVTHIYSGMSSVRRVNGRRLPGLLEGALLLDEMTVELIANGAHLPPELIRLVWQAKGPQHICVVSDGTAATGNPDGFILYRGQEGWIEDGAILRADRTGFLGSAVTTEAMFQNLVQRVGIPLADAVRMCATTPARSLGLGGRKGVLAPGFDGDLLAFDPQLTIRLVVIRGEIFYCDPALSS